ncbi:aspartate/glutamate racemase family protein [Brevibacterium ravenspurgense]|uniref:glutamate racemase n=1 Tax=Brevibacterium ravenspurgense TaxID=479117 RepID=UPI001EF358C2|nr:aspartate/glutamate racemase family protein [Brevibacterium ravenspurgense]MCG7300732.1 aspartate/glutamate racemase family protein [Brevibacterium ravenspurgense]
MTTIGVFDSGLGLTAFAHAIHRAAPQADLVLAMDPDFAPYGRLSGADVTKRALFSARTLAQHEPDAIVVACNTASVNALPALRKEFKIPIIGTVPAIKPAAEAGRPFAVWATPATTNSEYQNELIGKFAAGLDVHQTAAFGLAQAIDAADPVSIRAAVAQAMADTPEGITDIVLGCTHYGLVADVIRAARPGIRQLYDSHGAVAQQTLHRLGLNPSPEAQPTGRLRHVYLSGRPGELPAAVGAYPAGQALLDIAV